MRIMIINDYDDAGQHNNIDARNANLYELNFAIFRATNLQVLVQI